MTPILQLIILGVVQIIVGVLVYANKLDARKNAASLHKKIDAIPTTKRAKR